MKIVYLTFSIIPSALADSVQSMRMCHGLASAGHSVVLLAPNRPLPAPVSGEVHAYYGLPSSFTIRKLPWLHVMNRAYFYGAYAAWQARRQRPDLVYSRTIWEAMWTRWLGLPVVFESHSPVAGRVTAPFFRRFLKSPGLRRLVVISDALRRYYVDQQGMDPSRVVVARDGADPVPDNLPPPPERPGRTESLQIGYFGSLVEGRGLKLIADLAARHPEADFLVVGGTVAQAARWKAQRALPNLHVRASVAPGEIPRYLAACDILLAPYERKVGIGLGSYETTAWMSPMKLFEYMAAGKAILTSDLPALREFMEHERTAWLCPPEDGPAWEAALSRLMSDPNLRRQLGAAARSEVEMRYTWKARAETVLAGLVVRG